MTVFSSIIENNAVLTFCTVHDHLNKIFDPLFAEFDSLIRWHAVFNIFFVMLCLGEIGILIYFFATLAQSFMLALSLAVVFFTCFAFFTLRLYFQARKPEQFAELKDRYLSLCKEVVNYQENSHEGYKVMANACCKFANRLHGREYKYYKLPKFLRTFAPLMERISCWGHWEDVHYMKELLLKEAVAEQIKLVKSQPTSLEAHAALANAYIMLSGLYIDPKILDGYEEERWMPSSRYDEKLAEKFRATAERAIEEFKILSEYAPDDPWVHCQLAYSYHDLQMPMEEINEYETIQKLLPGDLDNLFKLGMLYFQQGMNAKGLKVYEELKKAHYDKAEQLITFYGSY